LTDFRNPFTGICNSAIVKDRTATQIFCYTIL